MVVISLICKSAFHSQEKSNGVIKFSSKIADTLLYERKSVDKPGGCY